VANPKTPEYQEQKHCQNKKWWAGKKLKDKEIKRG